MTTDWLSIVSCFAIIFAFDIINHKTKEDVYFGVAIGAGMQIIVSSAFKIIQFIAERS